MFWLCVIGREWLGEAQYSHPIQIQVSKPTVNVGGEAIAIFKSLIVKVCYCWFYNVQIFIIFIYDCDLRSKCFKSVLPLVVTMHWFYWWVSPLLYSSLVLIELSFIYYSCYWGQDYGLRFSSHKHHDIQMKWMFANWLLLSFITNWIKIHFDNQS